MWRQRKKPCPHHPAQETQGFLLTTDSAEGLDSNLLLCTDQPFPDSLGVDLAYLPYYRTSHVWGSPPSLTASSHILTEAQESSKEGKVDTKQDEKSIPPGLELSKRAISSTTCEKPPPHQLLRATTSELSLPMTSLPRGLPRLNQPLPCCGYFPYYRTEGEICTGPAQGNGPRVSNENPPDYFNMCNYEISINISFDSGKWGISIQKYFGFGES
ncbi:hypothetical protein WISP_39880 [Willisornis vidua]|uniref:Uncharacterized protein n=1 Tax=Willisornis vidua TaxID=1566151 RepID=A0ABQ9DH92_9PASS|nr:hypothetical protein WISP_39880 [Willisornis vidua]